MGGFVFEELSCHATWFLGVMYDFLTFQALLYVSLLFYS